MVHFRRAPRAKHSLPTWIPPERAGAAQATISRMTAAHKRIWSIKLRRRGYRVRVKGLGAKGDAIDEPTFIR
ncbi:MAG: hypothetical protein EU536_04670 [Promethearchaeota archaeon]|nr:MAG: hypothetical protein EU536_04670 [Candidatus Lokiarchaeota archaeon]